MKWRIFVSLYAISLCCPVQASETTTFTFDALGRLISSSNTNGPRSGKTNSLQYDPAGNRSAVAVGQPLPSPAPNAAIFSISGPSPVDEGGVVTFTITKSGSSSGSLSVNYATVNGTAVAPGDYISTSGTLTFLFWESVKTVAIATLTDAVSEGAEQFSVALTSPSVGASLGTASAAATINGSTVNQPPVTVADNLGNVGVCLTAQKNVVANDTDPEGHYPLSLVSVTSSPKGAATVVSTTDILISAYGTTGAGSVTYTVKDSLGAQSTGTLSFNVVSGQGCL